MARNRIQAALPLLIGAVLLALIIARGGAYLLQWQEPVALDDAQVRATRESQPASNAPRDFAQLPQLHLFGVEPMAPAPKPKEQIPETRAQLRLHGVFVDGDQSGAIIGEQNGRQHYVRVQGELPNGIKLKEVHSDHVVLERQGKDELLRFPKVETLNPTAPDPAPLARSAADGEPGAISLDSDSPASLADLADADLVEASRYLRVFPVHEAGVLVGYRVLPGRERELYQRLNLRPADIVTAIDSAPVAPDSAAFLNQLTARNDATLTVRRGRDTAQVQVSSQ